MVKLNFILGDLFMIICYKILDLRFRFRYLLYISCEIVEKLFNNNNNKEKKNSLNLLKNLFIL